MCLETSKIAFNQYSLDGTVRNPNSKNLGPFISFRLKKTIKKRLIWCLQKSLIRGHHDYLWWMLKCCGGCFNAFIVGIKFCFVNLIIVSKIIFDQIHFNIASIVWLETWHGSGIVRIFCNTLFISKENRLISTKIPKCLKESPNTGMLRC